MTNISTLLNSRKAALGTKHKKEQVIAPLFMKELGIEVLVPTDLDTDKFGTFTLDKERPANQKETAIIKAKAAMELLNLDLGIASEGTFGPHPAAPFGITNTEIVVFIDNKLGLEIFGGHVEIVSYAQNTTANNLEEVLEFADNINFPKHGIVIRSSEKKYKNMVKGIVTKDNLIEIATNYLEKYKSIWLETDFRAHVNKSRMKNIEVATKDLIENIKRLCPSCNTPGFHRISPKPGLPCEQCGRLTDIPLYDVYECDKCKFTQDVIFPHQKKTAYAGYCDYCNP